MSIPNLSKKLILSWSHSYVFVLKKALKMPNFQVLLTMVTTSSEACVLTSRKNVSKPGMSIPDLSEKIMIFLAAVLRFCFKKAAKNLNFQSFFISNKSFGGYFQWNLYTHFQKVCSWARYNNAQFMIDTSVFLVAFLCFCFTKTTLKMLSFQGFFTPKRSSGGYFDRNACTDFQKIWSLNKLWAL